MTTTVVVKNDFTVNEITLTVKIAETSISTVAIKKASATVDVKSILGLFTLGLRKGDIVVLESDDANVLTMLANFI